MARDVEPIALTVTGPRDVKAARFCNFPTGTARLLPAHVDWIGLQPIREALARPDTWVSLFGFASRRAASDFNLRLSNHRCEAVRARIAAVAPGVRFLISHGHGEEFSAGGPNDNDGYWRAVAVYISQGRPVRRPVPPPRPPAPSGSTRWRIRAFRGAGASVGVVQGDAIVLQIVDDQLHQCGVFYYVGAGAALSVGVTLPPGSIAAEGAFRTFRTTRPVTLHDFTGEAQLLQGPGVSVGDWSLGGTVVFTPASSHLAVFPGLRRTVLEPQSLELPAGRGFGIGLGSITGGHLSRPVTFRPGECCGAPGGRCNRFR